MVRGKGGVGEDGQAGEEVEGGEEGVAGGIGGDTSGGPHEAGHSLAAFEVGAFAIAKRLGGASVMPEAEPRSVVGGENDEGVLSEIGVANGFHQASDFGVEVFDDVGVGLLGVGLSDLIGHVEWNVRHGVGEVEEKGFLCLNGLFHKGDGFFGVASCYRSLIDGEFDDFLVF